MIDETFDEGTLDIGLEVHRDDQPVFIERLRVGAQNRLCGAVLNGRPVNGIALLNHAGTQHLNIVRNMIAGFGNLAGATLIEDVLILRYLGGCTKQARSLFTSIWQSLRLPLLLRPANTPRIWNT